MVVSGFDFGRYGDASVGGVILLTLLCDEGVVPVGCLGSD